jgi:cytochrome b
MNRVYVWDLPLRIFHWGLVICVLGSIITGSLGGNSFIWHFRFGYCVIGLLAFRIIWGFAGSKYSKFSSFPPSPVRAIAYLKGESTKGEPIKGEPIKGLHTDGEPNRHLGHNPLGAFSVYAILLALIFQVSTGLFANDAIMWDGPLRNYVSNSTSDLLTSLHKINRIILFVLIGLHLAAMAFYTWVKKEPLVGAMVSGYKEQDKG